MRRVTRPGSSCEPYRREMSGAFRIIYLATLPDRVPGLHAFQKKSHQTARTDIELAAKHFGDWQARDDT